MKTYFTNFPKFIDTIEELLTENRIFKQRSVDIGILSKDDAIKLSCSGPVLRASGVAWDLRKSQPYDVYGDLDFSIPVGKTGDTYDRYLVRMEEMRESVKIILQCIDKITEGPVMIEHKKITTPKRHEMKK